MMGWLKVFLATVVCGSWLGIRFRLKQIVLKEKSYPPRPQLFIIKILKDRGKLIMAAQESVEAVKKVTRDLSKHRKSAEDLERDGF